MNCINCRGFRTALVFFAGLITTSIANAQTKVEVVNTPTVDVKTLPAVTVSGTPTVHVSSLPPVTGSVSITNSPTVTVGNTVPVHVTNPASSVSITNTRATAVPVKDQYNPALQTLWNVFQQQPTTNSELQVNFPTPASQVVVVKHASAFCLGLPSATDMTLEVLVTQGTVTSPSVFIPLETKAGGVAVGGSPVDLTIPANGLIGLLLSTTTGSGDALCQVALNGYSVTVP